MRDIGFRAGFFRSAEGSLVYGRNKSESHGQLAKTLCLALGLVISAGLSVASWQTAAGPLLAWVVLIPLLLATRILTPSRAFIAGSFWGICLFLFSALSNGALFEPTLGALVLLSTIPAAYAWLGSRLTRRSGFSPLMLGLGWVVVELALQPLSLQNGLLGGMLGHALVVRTLGYLAGSLVVAFLVVYVSASVIEMATAAVAVPGGSRRAPRVGGAVSKCSPIELAAFSFQFLQPARARAPPTR
ncbi:MAG: hypothetical protein IH987_04355 [Planctomycetes bacterium]|nr:hypothetical protein [Planctomycetota bacterium]